MREGPSLSVLRIRWLLLFFIIVSAAMPAYTWKQGEKLNVYVVPHSHNDPGWWNTFEQYYTTWTRGILSSIVEVLTENRERTFIWAEISFFQRWWDEQSDSVKQATKKLVENGQLEFVTGGWVMNDEANCHMTDIVNQLTEGHEWLYKYLNTKPKVGWSIDPFGHSSSMPYLLQNMGFKAMVINRIHKEKKTFFRNNKHLEFYWAGANNQTGGPDFNMFTHVFPWKLYDIPNTCGPDWDTCAKFDFERDVSIAITPDNVEERSKILLNMYRKKAELFPHNHVLIPLGDDFKYKTVDMTRKIMTQYEMMFKYINGDVSLDTNVRFTTLSSYLEAVQEWAGSSSNVVPTYRGDFFTYCDEDQDYWSGYFTTRPFMKGLTRSTESVLRTGESLYVLDSAHSGRDNVEWFKAIETARRNLGIFQHHDGITGTARTHVVQDYARRLHESLWGVVEAASSMALSLLRKSDKSPQQTTYVWSHTPTGPTLTPAPRVLPREGISVIIVFNSLQHDRREVISAYVSTSAVKVIRADGQQVNVQLDPVWGENVAVDRFHIHFVGSVPAMGFSTFFVSAAVEEDSPYLSRALVKEYSNDATEAGNVPLMKGWVITRIPSSELPGLKITNQQYAVTFGAEGKIKEVRRFYNHGDKTGKELLVRIDHGFLSYSTHRSGAYLFLPNGPASVIHTDSSIRVVEGPIVKSVTIMFASSPLREYVVRLYNCDNTSGEKRKQCAMANMVEILHTLDMKGRFANSEVISRFSTNISNAGVFYTDSNGLEMVKREYLSGMPIQANYYPITSAAYLENSQKVRLTFLSHEAHGVGSLAVGSLEVMLDRQLQQDDNRGLGQPINDNVLTKIPLWLVLEQVAAPIVPALTPTAISLWQTRNYPLQQLYSVEPISQPEEYIAGHHLLFAPLLNAIPKNVHVLSMGPRNGQPNEVLLRLYTPFSTQSTVSSTYKVNLDMFGNFKPVSAKETSLSLMYDMANAGSSLIKTFVFTTEPQEHRIQNNIPKEEYEDEGDGIYLDERRDDKVDPSKDGPDFEMGEPHNPKSSQQTGGMGEMPASGVSVSEREKDTDIVGTDEMEVKIESKAKGYRPVNIKIADTVEPVTNLYAMSLMLYAGMAVCLFVGGWVCRQKSRSRGIFSWSYQNHPSPPTSDRDASVMKLL